MPSHNRQNGSRNVSAPSRASSIKSDATLSSRAMPAPPSNDVHPLPSYVAASAAAELATDYHLERIQDQYLQDDESFAEPNGAFFTEPALAIVNNFLDQLLYSFLAAARSTSLSSLRPAVEQVLKGKLARHAIESADEELQELLGGGDEEDDLTAMQGEDEPTTKWDTNAVWKRTRLRIMVYTRLGELEDEDEERYVEEEGLESDNDGSGQTAPTSGLVSWSAAIFLTSVLEFIAEQCLAVAAQAAYDRADGQTTSRPSTRDGDEERVVIAEHDVERVALNSSLGRLWRTWRKSIRSSTRRSGLTSGSSSRRPSVSSNRLTMNSNRDGESRSRSGTVASKTSPHDLLATAEARNRNDRRNGSTDETQNGNSSKDVAVKRVRSLLTFPEMVTTSPVLPNPDISNVKTAHQRSYSVPAGEPTSMDIFLKRLAESKASIQARMTAKSEEDVSAKGEDVPKEVPADATVVDGALLDEQDLEANQFASQKNETHFDDTASVTTFDDEHEQEMEGVLGEEDSTYVHEGVGEQPKIAQTVRVRSTSAALMAVNVVNQQSSPPRATNKPDTVIAPEEVTAHAVDDTYERSNRSLKDSPTEVSKSYLDEPPAESLKEKTVARLLHDMGAVAKDGNIAVPSTTKAEVSPRGGKKRPKAIQVAPDDIDTSMFPPTPKHAPVGGMTIPKSIEPSQQAHSSSVETSQTPTSGASEYRRGSSASSKYSTAVGSLRTHNSGPDTTSPLVTKLSHDLPTPRSRSGSHAQVDTREKDFDDLMNAEETVKYTLTPKNLRNLDQTNALGIKHASPSITRSELPSHDFDSYPEGQPTPKQRTPRLATPSSKAGSEWSGPSDISTAVIADASTLTVGPRKARRPPSTNSNSSKKGLVAREPRIQTESTRDFADFIRSTAPDGKMQQVQPILMTSVNTPSRSAIASPLMSRRGSLDVQYGSKVTDLSKAPPVPTSKPKVSQQKFEPRNPINTERVDKDMIAFFRQGPPTSGAVGSSQPPRNDSINSARPIYGNPARGNRESSTTVQSAPDSVNSHTGLLSSARSNGYRSGASEASSYNQPSKASSGAPVRKQRRVKDPYAVDFSDEEDGDIVTELPPKQESLADFLNNYDPPPEDPTPPSRIVSKSTFGGRRGRKLGGKSASQPTVVSDHPPQIPADFASPRQGYSNGIPPPREGAKGNGMKGFLKKMSSAA